MELLIIVALAVVAFVTYMGFNPREPPPSTVEMSPLIRPTEGMMQIVQLDLGPESEDEWVDWDAGYGADIIEFVEADDSSSEVI